MTATMPSPAITDLDHERLRGAIADLPALLRIADQARGFYGPIDCAEGGCEHTGDGDQCPLLQVRYATADDLERLDDTTTVLTHIHALAKQGLTVNPAVGLELFAQIADLAGGPLLNGRVHAGMPACTQRAVTP